jgi:hypothetical protein
VFDGVAWGDAEDSRKAIRGIFDKGIKEAKEVRKEEKEVASACGGGDEARPFSSAR